jgi:amidase
MWTTEDFAWSGRHFRMRPRNVIPKPLQKPHPPLWVAVQSPETAVQAGERGMGMLGVTLGSPLDYQQIVRDYRRAIRTCEPVGAFVNEQVNGVAFMHCQKDDGEAKTLGMMAMMNFMARAAHLVGVGSIYPSPAYHAHSSAAPLRNRPGDVIANLQGLPIGDPATCIKALRWWEEVGVDRMVFLIQCGEVLPREKVLESLRLFGREVIPELDKGEPRAVRDRGRALMGGGEMEKWLFGSARRMRDALRAGDVSARELTEACLARIESVNARLNAVVTLRADQALAEAAAADRALSSGTDRRPLLGVPITLKDSIDTAGVRTTWGTPGRRDHVPARDATVARRLREAGVVLLGKTNTPEFTLSGHTSNPIFGHTRNPYDPARSPGGSSGGAASIVAAGGAAFDLGSDTGGSIRLPSHFCGIAGLRPSAGRVSRDGHAIGPELPLEALTQIGPMGRFVEDLALVLPLIAGPDGRDVSVAPAPAPDLGAVSLRELRVCFYLTNRVVEPSPEIQEGVRRAARALERTGARVVEQTPPGVEEGFALFGRLIVHDGGAWVRRLLDRCGTRLEESSLAPLTRPGAPSFDAQARTFEDWSELRARMLRFLDGCDLVLAPAASCAAPKIEPGFELPWLSYTMPYNLAGWPGAVVRSGTSAEGLPIGVQVLAGPWREDRCLVAAALLERELGGYQPPSL